MWNSNDNGDELRKSFWLFQYLLRSDNNENFTRRPTWVSYVKATGWDSSQSGNSPPFTRSKVKLWRMRQNWYAMHTFPNLLFMAQKQLLNDSTVQCVPSVQQDCVCCCCILKFISDITKARHWTLTSASSISCILTNHSLRNIWILYFHPFLRLSRILFHKGELYEKFWHLCLWFKTYVSPF
jgi:hypothetical protein